MGVHVRASRDEWWARNPTDCLLCRGSTHARPPTKAAGEAAVHIVVQLRETEIDELVRKGLLQADARNDVYAVRNALHAHFDRTFGTAK